MALESSDVSVRPQHWPASQGCCRRSRVALHRAAARLGITRPSWRRRLAYDKPAVVAPRVHAKPRDCLRGRRRPRVEHGHRRWVSRTTTSAEEVTESTHARTFRLMRAAAGRGFEVPEGLRRSARSCRAGGRRAGRPGAASPDPDVRADAGRTRARRSSEVTDSDGAHGKHWSQWETTNGGVSAAGRAARGGTASRIRSCRDHIVKLYTGGGQGYLKRAVRRCAGRPRPQSSSGRPRESEAHGVREHYR